MTWNRFYYSRYECEGRSAGALHGGKSSGDNKTYPTIQIVGYTGPAVCVVSLVEHEKPYRAHPHNLVGKDGKFGTEIQHYLSDILSILDFLGQGEC